MNIHLNKLLLLSIKLVDHDLGNKLRVKLYANFIIKTQTKSKNVFLAEIEQDILESSVLDHWLSKGLYWHIFKYI